MRAVTISQVADELYGLPPGEFIAARDDRARAARAAGRQADAAAIKKLARPTASAFLVNQLSRGAPEPLGRLLEVGAALQQAQRTLAGDRLRELSAERRQVVTELLAVAAGLAGKAGESASAGVLAEVRATLEAALADPAAGEAVRAGRLTKALAYAGLGEVDLSAALAQAEAAEPEPEPESAPESDSAPEPEPSPAERARLALAEAESSAATAATSVAAAEQELSAVDEQRQFLRRRITHLERELAGAQDEETRLARDAQQARQRRDAAARELRAAQQRLARARRTAGG